MILSGKASAHAHFLASSALCRFIIIIIIIIIIITIIKIIILTIIIIKIITIIIIIIIDQLYCVSKAHAAKGANR